MKTPIVRGRFSRTIRRDVKSIFEVFFSRLNQSDVIHQYEETLGRHIGCREVISFAYARTAFWAILKSLDLKPGDKVLLPAISIKPLVDITLSLNLEPIFVDSDLATGCVNISSLREVLEMKPRVFLLTYLFGVVPNMNEIMAELEGKEVYLVEDISQCLNGSYNRMKLGTFGHASILSTSSVKNLDTYGGGLVLTSDIQLASRCRLIQQTFEVPKRLVLIRKVLVSSLKNILSSRILFSLFLFPFIYFFANRQSTKFSRFVGNRSQKELKSLPAEWFSTYSSFQAKVGLKLIRKVEVQDKQRINVASTYIRNFPIIRNKSQDVNIHSIYWQAILLAKNPQLVRKLLAKHFVDSATTSLVLLSHLPYLKVPFATPNASILHNEAIYLPCYRQLKIREVNQVISAVQKLKEHDLLSSHVN
jgi:dTDP-4-amino-4,6-dideoxygalactose transaminase